MCARHVVGSETLVNKMKTPYLSNGHAAVNVGPCLHSLWECKGKKTEYKLKNIVDNLSVVAKGGKCGEKKGQEEEVRVGTRALGSNKRDFTEKW